MMLRDSHGDDMIFFGRGFQRIFNGIARGVESAWFAAQLWLQELQKPKAWGSYQVIVDMVTAVFFAETGGT